MRRRPPDNSSLELLLDTICNTFGGVLFLAILVCILLRNTGHSTSVTQGTPQFSEADVLDLVRRQQELETSLEGLRAATSEQDRLAAQFVQPDIHELRDTLAQEQNERESLDTARRSLLADIASKQAKAAAIEKELADLEQDLSNARANASKAQSALDSELKSHSVTAALPRERGSIKREIGFVVRYGRLYQWLRYDSAGNSTGLNVDEFVVVDDRPDRIETRPKPHAGLPLEDADGDQIANKVRQFSPANCYLAIAVWEDSFDVFQKLKAGVVAAGFEYRLILMQDGNSLMDRGGSDHRVQ